MTTNEYLATPETVLPAERHGVLSGPVAGATSAWFAI